jgi:hypothetical protein
MQKEDLLDENKLILKKQEHALVSWISPPPKNVEKFEAYCFSMFLRHISGNSSEEEDPSTKFNKSIFMDRMAVYAEDSTTILSNFLEYKRINYKLLRELFKEAFEDTGNFVDTLIKVHGCGDEKMIEQLRKKNKTDRVYTLKIKTGYWAADNPDVSMLELGKLTDDRLNEVMHKNVNIQAELEKYNRTRSEILRGAKKTNSEGKQYFETKEEEISYEDDIKKLLSSPMQMSLKDEDPTDDTLTDEIRNMVEQEQEIAKLAGTEKMINNKFIPDENSKSKQDSLEISEKLNNMYNK